MKAWLLKFFHKHFDRLLEIDFRVAALFGAPKHHTISGNAWRLEMAGKPWGKFLRPRIDAFFLFLIAQENHCRDAYYSEMFSLKK
jgi:hypothetical protein